VGNYNWSLMKIGIQTKKSKPSSEITKTEAKVKFQDGRGRHFFLTEVIAVKWAFITRV
jgi:hypothetical protein